MKNMAQFLPFLDDDAIDELITKVENGEETNLNLAALMPFANDNHLQRIFNSRIAKGLDVSFMMPFVNESVLNQFVLDVVNGKVTYNQPLTTFLPFISGETTNALYTFVDEQGGIHNGLSLSNLMPFVDDHILDERFIISAKNGQIRKEMVPFVSDEALDQLVNSYLNGELDLDLDILLPFLSKEQVRKVFTYEMNKQSNESNT